MKKTKKVLKEVLSERVKQEKKWGQQNWPILDPTLLDRKPQRMCEEFGIPSETMAKGSVDLKAKRGDLTYMEILVEEVSEAASCGRNTEALRKEIIQIAAVAVAMVERIDRGF